MSQAPGRPELTRGTAAGYRPGDNLKSGWSGLAVLDGGDSRGVSPNCHQQPVIVTNSNLPTSSQRGHRANSRRPRDHRRPA